MVFVSQRGLQSIVSQGMGSINSTLTKAVNTVSQYSNQPLTFSQIHDRFRTDLVNQAINRNSNNQSTVNNNTTNIIDQASTQAIQFLGRELSNLSSSLNNTLSQPTRNYDAILAGINDLRGTVINETNDLLGIDINGTIDRVENLIRGVFDRVLKEARDSRDFLGRQLNNTVKVIDNTLNSAGSGISKGFNGLVDKIGGIENNATKLVNSALSRFENLLKGLAAKASSVINKAPQIIAKSISPILSIVKNYTGNIVSSFGAKVDSLVKIGTEQVNSLKTNFYKNIKALFEAIRVFIGERLELFTENIGGIIKRTIEVILESTPFAAEEFRVLSEQLVLILGRIVNNEYNSFDDIERDLNLLGSNPGIAFRGVMVLAGLAGFLPLIFSISRPFIENIEHLSMEQARPTLLTPVDTASAFYRGLINQGRYSAELGKVGLSDERIELVKKVSRPLIDPAQIQFNFLRGNITESEHDRMLGEYGFTEDRISLIKHLYFVLPGVQDLITMAVREVFSPDVVEAFGQKEDFPEEFARVAEQQGLTREWAENYWAAHWGLPSPRQGFEMLHRRIVDEDELSLLLRALDVMPFWRDKLIQLSYNPITRVDVRRIYRIGEFDREQVFDAYLDLGYSPEKAEFLTRFTEITEAPKPPKEIVLLRKTVIDITMENYLEGRIDREFAIRALNQLGMEGDAVNALLSVQDLRRQHLLRGEGRLSNALKVRKMILKAYKNRSMSREEVIQAATQLGIDSVEIEIDLNDVDIEVDRIFKQKIIERVQDLYMGFTIEQQDVFSILGENDFEPLEIEDLINKMDVMRAMGERKPTKRDFETWLEMGFITDEQFETELLGLRYNRKYVNYYMRQMRQEREQ